MNIPSIGQKLLSKFKTSTPSSCFIGFDGFTDEIIRVVDKATSDTPSFIPTIEDFGKKILQASKKSGNFELVVKETKLGGNAPLFTNALLEGGHSVTFAGNIGGINNIEPLFQEMCKRCKKVFPMGASGKTDALEFQDGKLILGKLESLKDVNYENLLKQIDEKALIKLLEKTDLFASLNWTMIKSTTDIWKNLLKRIAPKLSEKQRHMFVDLADPRKRTDQDVLEAMHILSKLNDYFDVILGLNISEAEILCKIFKIKFAKESSEAITNSAKRLFKKLGLTRLLVHHATFAILQDDENTIYLKSFYTKKPKLTTGAGDNFNAGYCNGLLYGMSQEEALVIAIATAGFYVRNGQSPTIEQVVEFFKDNRTRDSQD